MRLTGSIPVWNWLWPQPRRRQNMTDCRLEYMAHNPLVAGSSPAASTFHVGGVAQWQSNVSLWSIPRRSPIHTRLPVWSTWFSRFDSRPAPLRLHPCGAGPCETCVRGLAGKALPNTSSSAFTDIEKSPSAGANCDHLVTEVQNQQQKTPIRLPVRSTSFPPYPGKSDVSRRRSSAHRLAGLEFCLLKNRPDCPCGVHPSHEGRC